MTGAMMGDTERRAIVWDTIERIAFRPAGDKDRRTWLSLYIRYIQKLWGLQPGDNQRSGERDGFAIPLLEIDCRWHIENPEKYSITLSKQIEPVPAGYWHLEVDPQFSSRREYCKTSAAYPPHDKARHLEGDVQAVLDGMIFHPRNHAHIEELGVEWSDSPENIHEVRLGGGIENAFVFLVHLGYQFCLLSEQVREKERNRLNSLFAEAIRTNCRSLPARDVLDFKRNLKDGN